MNDVKNKVLDQIKGGKVAMRPRWHFVLKGALVLVGMCILILGLVYLESFIMFVLIGTGLGFIPAFGLAGLVTFLLSAPWLLIILAILFVLILEYLVCNYSFGYRKPLLYTVLGIVGFSVLGAFLVSESGLHYQAMERAKDSRLPIVGGMYRDYGLAPHKEVHLGVFSTSTERGFILLSRTGDDLEVVINSSTKVPSANFLLPGQRLLILGFEEGGEVIAKGIRPFYNEEIKSLIRNAREEFFEHDRD